MRCPRCEDEYEPGVDLCADCGLPLVPDDVPPPPTVDALLGTFHPEAASAVVRLLVARTIPFDVVRVEDRVEVAVDRGYRDDLRAELVVRWSELLATLPAETMYAVIATGGSQPGWHDAPRGAWVDRAGRLQVDGSDDEDEAVDRRRVVGPSLTFAGVLVVLLAWYAGGDAGWVAGGVVAILAGLVIPR